VSVVILRVDGGPALGMGHVVRCEALADALQARGATPVFVTLAGGAASRLRQAGRRVEIVGADLDARADAAATIAIAARTGARVIVTDVCSNAALQTPELLQELHARLGAAAFVVALTGGTLVDLAAGLLVSPYVHTEGLARPGLLAGPRYYIAGRAWAAAAARPRVIRDHVHRVLVTLGGSDPAALTPRVLAALETSPVLELDVRVVVGPCFQPSLREATVLAAAPPSARLLEDDVDLPAEMAEADLAVIADGLTKYEAAMVGTPSVCLEVPGSDRSVNETFAQAGTTVYVAQARQDALGGVIAALLGDAARRRSMSAAGRALLDGRGTDRVLDAVPRHLLTRDVAGACA
jgi:spore coat polysaccharide biosynthesis predicted glycosyltransferase SpsG